MTLIPPGAHIAPVDLPPPPPSADPREPSPTATRSRPGARTPVRHRSPNASRASSPAPAIPHRSSAPASALPIDHSSPGPALVQPRPVNLSPSHSAPNGVPHPHQHFGHHLSRPSSPASIHSSTSAIFERDIELPSVASLTLNPQPQGLNHKPSRLFQPHGSNLDNTVPAVLDDAVEALTAQEDSNALEIEAPAPSAGINMARQSSASLANISQGRKVSTGGVLTSRSSSPISIGSRSSGVASPVQSPPIMGQLSTQGLKTESPNLSPTGISATLSRPMMGQRISTGPILPGGWSSGYNTQPEPEVPSATSLSPPPEEGLTPPNPIPSHLSPSKDKRRISFISYNDLLLSVPTTVTPLGEITSGHQPPDHLPGTVSPSVSNSRSPHIPAAGGVFGSGNGVEEEHSTPIGAGAPGSGLGFGGEGEWQREGLGKGLEQRLEDLVQKSS